MPSSFATVSGLFQNDVCGRNCVSRRSNCCIAVTALVIFLFLYHFKCCPRRIGFSTSNVVSAPSSTYPPLNDVVRTGPADHHEQPGRRRFVKNCTNNASSVPLIPAKSDGSEFTRIIHRTWMTYEVPPTQWTNGENSCRDANPTYQYCLWTDAELESFIAIEYSWFLETYRGYTYDIQRVDAARYFIVYHYGGVYINLDLACRQSFDDMLSVDYVSEDVNGKFHNVLYFQFNSI